MGGTNEDWEALRKPTVYGLREHGFKEYGVSKLAQILFTLALSERAANWLNGTRLIARAVHPGGVGTGGEASALAFPTVGHVEDAFLGRGLQNRRVGSFGRRASSILPMAILR